MRCDECPLVMLDELYGLLEPEESAALAAHVATCPACAAAFAKAKADQAKLQTAFPDLSIVQVDERYSSLEARDRYWQMYPPQGLTRLIPQGMRQPPRPIDEGLTAS